MAPGGKRKRGDARSYAGDDDSSNRPSPHRPQNLTLAQAQQTNSPRGGRRGSRTGGRGGSSAPHSPSVSHASPSAMSPPASAYQASKLVHATPSTPVPSKEQPSTQSATPQVPESNDHLTPERVANWNAAARNAVVQVAITAQRDGDIFNLAVVFHEIIQACMEKCMDPEELGSMVREIVAAPSDDSVDPAATFLDTMSSLTENEEVHAQLRQMLLVTDIDVTKIRSELESSLLTSLELVRPSFSRVAVRKATNALYRQTNYNLLREETEGFSKLITEYFTTVNNERPNGEVVSDTYRRVNGFIGAFDLDVGRVLDVTLDVFANLLVKHGRFFVKYLRASAWWPELQGTDGMEWEEPEVRTLPNWALPESFYWYDTDAEKEEQLQLREQRDQRFWQRVAHLGDRAGIKAFFELGARRITRKLNETENSNAEDKPGSSKQTATQQWTDEWIAQTGTLPPPGNDIAAQLLGFKLRFYASDARDTHDILPDNLIYLAALLIKIGFISLMDLYPHLYPADEDMPAHREKLEKEKKDKEAKRRGKSMNALAMAGALPDDTLPAPAVLRLREAESKPSSKPESGRSTPAKSDDEAKTKLPEPADQKVALLRSLLCIGALPEALFILGRFPWLLDVYPDLHAFVFRLAHHSLNKVYEASRPVPPDKIPCVAKGANTSPIQRLSDFEPRRTLRWAKPDQKDAGDGIDYRFYWEDWANNVPICQDVDDVFRLCNSLLALIGAECGRDIMLMTKLARIGKKSVTQDPSPENLKRWSDFSATFLAPALTFTGQNPGVVNEMWELFRRFDTGTRYTIYSHWFRSTKPALRVAFQEVFDDTRDLLGKISATNTRPMGRAMAKLACACPGVVFQQTLKQGQSYINMIDALVECSRYLTSLGYDCLTWALVNTFITNNKETLQGDGMLIKPWLKNTAIFIGKVYKRFSLMDPTPVLQFITHQLLCPTGELHMLAVLEQIIVSMAGIGLSGALTEARVLSLSAGPSLRAYTLEHHLGDHRHQAKSPARRLIRSLKETGLTPQILIALARQVESYLFREELEGVPDKVVFTNYDNLRSSFAQYLEFLRENLAAEEFDETIPGLVELMSEYHLEASLAFHISRASIALKVDAIRLKELPRNGIATDGDVVMGGVETASAPNGIFHNNPTNTEDVEMIDVGPDTPTGTNEPNAENSSTRNAARGARVSPTLRSNAEIEALAAQLKAALPDKYADHPCLTFFVTFWQLSVKDVYNPNGMELKKQYDDCKTYFNNKASTSSPDRRNFSQAKAEVKKLDEEYEALSKTARLTQSRLQEEMQQWFNGFPMVDQRSDTLHNTLLQDCFLPRLRMSLDDAQFSSTMLFFMHRSGVPGFRTAKLLDQLFNADKLSCIIAMSSEEEAKCFGRFVNDVLRELQRWHDDKDIYLNFAHGEDEPLPGFGRSWNPDRTPSHLISYEDFRHLLYKWHRGLFLAVKHCLQGGQYTELRNTINILKALSPVFPKVDTMAKDLRQIIEQHAKDEDRDDVKVAANSLLYEFKRSAKFWKSEIAFKQGQEAANASSASPKTGSEQSKAPQPQDTTSKKLNVAAATFQPKTPEVNGLPRLALEKNAIDQKQQPPAPTTASAVPRLNGRDTNKSNPTLREPNPPIPTQGRDTPNPKGPTLHSAPSTSIPGRSDNRSALQPTPPGRVAHALPTRPDAQPSRPRPPERTSERQAEYNGHGRHDVRGNPPVNEYGRPDRVADPPRDREASPGRRNRPRTPDRGPGPNSTERRDRPLRDSREYDDRLPRPPPRDVRGPPGRGNNWAESLRDSRDARDSRDYRERDSLREPLREPLREHPREHPRPPPRETPREPPREPFRQPHREPAREPVREPAREALRQSHREPPREPIREAPRDRADARGPPHPPSASLDGRSRMHSSPIVITDERRRDTQSIAHREDRNSLLPPRPPPNASSTGNEGPRLNPERAALINENRGRETSRPDREVPTGPRSGRNDAPVSTRPSRDMFQPSQPRSAAHHTQDPNYGRLNPPTESIPSGPRSTAQATPTAPAAAQPGIHPSRLNQIDVPGAPSGPRGSTRTQPNTLRAINSVLTQNAPPDRPAERPHRRSEKPGRERSKSPDRRSDALERRPDASDRRQDAPERRPDERERERSSRDRRDRRDRDRDRDRDSRREEREREERRESSGRKRTRDPMDQGSHGDQKRSRRSN